MYNNPYYNNLYNNNLYNNYNNNSNMYNPNNGLYNNNNNIQQYQFPTINGKFVEGEEIVKNTEVPFNSYGIFPKADLSCIYYKQWNIDGTTKIIPYIPTVQEEPKTIADYDDILNSIQKSVNELNKKLSSYPAKNNNNRQEVKKDD